MRSDFLHSMLFPSAIVAYYHKNEILLVSYSPEVGHRWWRSIYSTRRLMFSEHTYWGHFYQIDKRAAKKFLLTSMKDE